MGWSNSFNPSLAFRNHYEEGSQDKLSYYENQQSRFALCLKGKVSLIFYQGPWC